MFATNQGAIRWTINVRLWLVSPCCVWPICIIDEQIVTGFRLTCSSAQDVQYSYKKSWNSEIEILKTVQTRWIFDWKLHTKTFRRTKFSPPPPFVHLFKHWGVVIGEFNPPHALPLWLSSIMHHPTFAVDSHALLQGRCCRLLKMMMFVVMTMLAGRWW